MRPPSVFVSSTCYDLQQIRVDLREFLANLGLDPVLSEFASFPVNPDASTLDNCLKAVEQRADIFVLVIGGRYGSVKGEGASITNLEFLRARAKGIPVYSFVERRLLDMLPIWKANPGGDFTPVVDTPKVFEFIVNIRESGELWVFPFETAQDISATLRSQLSYLFKDALDIRHRVHGSDAIPETLRHLSGEPMRLVIERPPNWEYLFFAEALQKEIARYSDTRRDWEHGISFGSEMRMNLLELTRWFPAKFSEARRLGKQAGDLLNTALQKAVGLQGTSGNPEEIYYVAVKLGEVY